MLDSLDFRGLGGEVFGVFPGQADGVDFCGFWPVQPTPEEISVLRLAWEDLAV